MWYLPERATIYQSLSYIPTSSFLYATVVSFATAILWFGVYLSAKHKVWKLGFVTFHGDGQWYLKESNFWKIMASDLATICDTSRVMVAFLLLYFVRQKIGWHEKVKTMVWTAARKVENVSFIIGGILSGDDAYKTKARHDIYRWLVCAHFLNHRALSPHLAKFSETSLVGCGLMSTEEAVIIAKRSEIEETTRPRGGMLQHPATSARLQLIQNDVGSALAHQNDRDAMARARDTMVWWMEIQLQSKVKEKMLDKDKLKKSMAALWGMRDSLEELLLESTRQQMFFWVILTQSLVDLYVILSPFNALTVHYHAHLWTLPTVMVRTWLVAFFYESLMNITRTLFNPFAMDLDMLHLDPVLVMTERSVFANLGHTEEHDMPQRLKDLWWHLRVGGEAENSPSGTSAK